MVVSIMAASEFLLLDMYLFLERSFVAYAYVWMVTSNPLDIIVAHPMSLESQWPLPQHIVYVTSYSAVEKHFIVRI